MNPGISDLTTSTHLFEIIPYLLEVSALGSLPSQGNILLLDFFTSLVILWNYTESEANYRKTQINRSGSGIVVMTFGIFWLYDSLFNISFECFYILQLY